MWKKQRTGFLTTLAQFENSQPSLVVEDVTSLLVCCFNRIKETEKKDFFFQPIIHSTHSTGK